MTYLHISLPRLLLSLVLIAVAVALSRRSRLGLESDLIWGAVRGAAQLIAVGYVLLLLFDHERPIWVVLLLAVMLIAAAATSSRRVEHGPPRSVLFPRALVAIGTGALVALLPVFVAVVPLHPWYEARYLVPISGMMLSSAMNVVALVFERIFASASGEADRIEALLALGATPRQALEGQVRATLRAALLPTINGLFTVGLVALPGMMTGQIVSGTAPEQAVRYQIVTLYQLVAVAAVSGLVAVALARRLLFTTRAQLVLPESAPAGRARLGARQRGDGARPIAGASLDPAP